MELLLHQWISSALTSEGIVISIHDQQFEEYKKFLEAFPALSTNDELLVNFLKVIGLRLIEYRRDLGEEFRKKQIELLRITCSNDKFLNTFKIKVTEWSDKKSKKKDLETVLVVMLAFFKVILKKIPVLGMEFLLLFDWVKTILPVITSSQQAIKIDKCFLGGFTSMKGKIEKMCTGAGARMEEQRKRVRSLKVKYKKSFHKGKLPENFRTSNIAPSLEELKNKKGDVYLRPNKTIGGYDSGDEYLDRQFRLLREDFVKPIREIVLEIIKDSSSGIERPTNTNPKDKNTRIYTNITYTGKELSIEHGHEYLFSLPPELAKSVNWDKSKRFLPGCLVVLTSDNCQTAVFGVTLPTPVQPSRNPSLSGDSSRKELSNGILRLSIEDVKEAKTICAGNRYTLIECEAYFEAYKHILNILQKIDFLDIRSHDCSPMAKYIISASRAVALPSYFSKTGSTKLNLHFNCGQVLQVDCRFPNSWDQVRIQEGMGLNIDQFNALQMALTHELSLIQGPPGTGKTFVGLQIVKTLYLNKFREKDDAKPSNAVLKTKTMNKCDNGWANGTVPEGPFLVLCHTNHALDQFLELLLKSIENLKVVRVGGQCKSEKLQQFTLTRIRRDRQAEEFVPPTYRKYRNEKINAQRSVRKFEDKLNRLMDEIAELRNPNGIFCFRKMVVHEKLRLDVPEKFLKNLSCESWLKIEWSDFNDPFKLEESILNGFVMDLKGMKKELPGIVEKWKGSFDKKDESDEVKGGEDNMEKAKGQDVGVGMHKYKLIYLKDCCIQQCVAKADQFENENRELQCENKSDFLTAILALHKHKSRHFGLPFLDDRFQSKEADSEEVRYRWAVYFKVLKAALKCAEKFEKQLCEELQEARKKLEIAKLGCISTKPEYSKAMEKMNTEILKDCDIIGMTTTGAAKNYSLLEKAGVSVVIVEEAAEILEAHVITALTSHCKQLILIEDHLQLKPNTIVHELGTYYQMNVSFFERMIKNGLPYVQLKTQHRMRPEISNLIVGPIYKELLNHPDVTDFPPVKGIVKSMFFIDHRIFEDKNSDVTSKSNKHEALFIAALCNYLRKQGYEKNRVTVLTMYAGQMFLLKQLIGRDLKCRGVHITCVDSYQGEENDIILLSLVRSNAEGNVGFVGIDNRICVALSRARHGLYVIGNMQCLTKNSKSKTWKAINEKLIDSFSIGEGLELVCEKHVKKATVKIAEDFDKLCTVACGEVLRCGHVCPLTCHLDKEIHDEKCEQPCSRKIQACGHYCQKLCCEMCEGACTTQVLKILKCGHSQFVACSEDIWRVKCRTEVSEIYLDCWHKRIVRCDEAMTGAKLFCEAEVEVQFRGCGHKEMVLCKNSNSKTAKCSNRCNIKLPCGHLCQSQRCCHWNNDPAHLLYKCTQNCDRKLKCDHSCAVKHMCHDNCPACKATSQKKLPCGHGQLVRCGVDPIDAKCTLTIRCQKQCSSGHRCDSDHACSDECPPCREKVMKKFPSCGHELELQCHVLQDGGGKCTEKQCMKAGLPTVSRAAPGKRKANYDDSNRKFSKKSRGAFLQ